MNSERRINAQNVNAMKKEFDFLTFLNNFRPNEINIRKPIIPICIPSWKRPLLTAIAESVFEEIKVTISEMLNFGKEEENHGNNCFISSGKILTYAAVPVPNGYLIIITNAQIMVKNLVEKEV